MGKEQIQQLKTTIKEAVAAGDIAKLYMLEQQANDYLDEELLIGYYKNILDLAIERLTQTLQSHTKMNFDDVQDFSALRALYEYAMEHYHAGKSEDAAALFEILSGISDNKAFGNAMRVHALAAQQGVNLEDFLESYADMEAVEAQGNFYIGDFTAKAQELLNTPKGEHI